MSAQERWFVKLKGEPFYLVDNEETRRRYRTSFAQFVPRLGFAHKSFTEPTEHSSVSEARAWIKTLRADGRLDANDKLVIVRRLTLAEAKRKAAAVELRSIADKIREHRADESHASYEIAFGLERRADELWPVKGT